jgi:class 3 adenylate cyclase
VEQLPETRYVRALDGAYLAYAVSGGGPIDLVAMLLSSAPLEPIWTFPPAARLLHRLEAFSRLIRWDMRGTGLSDRADSRWPPLEEHARDLISVLDAVGVDRVALYANNLGGLVTIFFAATYPERVSHLVLDGCYARYAWAEDYPIGSPLDVLERALDRVGDPAALGRGVLDGEVGLKMLAPSAATDPDIATGFNRLARHTNPPATARAHGEAAVFTDLRPLLGSLRCPTLVLYRSEDRFAGEPFARYLAEHIEGARLVEIPGQDNLCFLGDHDALIGELEEFLIGRRSGPEFERILATVLFTDIVASTDRVSEVGDRQWRKLLDEHDEAAREEIERFQGRFVKTTGDGVVATFDGPARGIRCAQAMAQRARALGLDVRAGLHTGEVEFRANDLHGLAVHVAQRVSSIAGAGEVVVSRTVVDLVAGSDLQFEDRGDHELKGVPGEWRLYAAVPT